MRAEIAYDRVAEADAELETDDQQLVPYTGTALNEGRPNFEAISETTSHPSQTTHRVSSQHQNQFSDGYVSSALNFLERDQ